MTRALVRGALAITVVFGFIWLVENAPWVLFAILAAICTYISWRAMPPLNVPPSRAAFPDPVGGTEGASSGAASTGRAAHASSVIQSG